MSRKLRGECIGSVVMGALLLVGLFCQRAGAENVLQINGGRGAPGEIVAVPVVVTWA